MGCGPSNLNVDQISNSMVLNDDGQAHSKDIFNIEQSKCHVPSSDSDSKNLPLDDPTKDKANFTADFGGDDIRYSDSTISHSTNVASASTSGSGSAPASHNTQIKNVMELNKNLLNDDQDNCNYLNTKNECFIESSKIPNSCCSSNYLFSTELPNTTSTPIYRIISPECPTAVKQLLSDLQLQNEMNFQENKKIFNITNTSQDEEGEGMVKVEYCEEDNRDQQTYGKLELGSEILQLIKELQRQNPLLHSGTSQPINQEVLRNSTSTELDSHTESPVYHQFISSRRIVSRQTPDSLVRMSDESQELEISDSIVESNPLLGIRGTGDDNYSRSNNLVDIE